MQKKMEAQKAMQNVKCGNDNCGTTSTTLWRKDPNGRILCNSCGLFLKVYRSSQACLVDGLFYERVRSHTWVRN